MTLRNIETIEYYDFENLADLRDWLNRFKKTDLGAVNIEHGEFNRITLNWDEETLSDGSKVFNARFT